MSERDNLLLRWARLKQAAKAAEKVGATSHDSDAMAAPEAPFDPASLPSIEAIVANTDIIGFLRADVPAELTRAALRRAWTSDPTIRDFIGIAENQWDFNDPNAIPGFGPLTPAESGVDILAQISTRLERQAGTLDELTAAEAIPLKADATELDRQLAADDPIVASRIAPPNEVPAVLEGESVPTANKPRRSRRHGSALPH